MSVYNSLDGLENKKWQSPKDTTYINKLFWGEAEVKNIVQVLESDWFAGNSKFNEKFEDKIKEFTGLKYFQSTNSGSAALEIAVQVLVQKGIWQAGDKILHPACTFPTSISAAIMAGLEIIFIDVGEGTYVIDENGLELAFSKYPNIKGAIIPALLGNVPNVDSLRKYLGDNPIIFDSCDTMGSKWDEKEFTQYADLCAYSFYGSHHLSTFGVGGGVGTNNPEYAKLAKSLTFWGRDFSTDNEKDKVKNFLSRYSYETVGFDAQMSAVQAAFGLAQIEKLPKYIEQRHNLFTKLQRLFVRYEEFFILPTRTSNKADVSWFCYPLTVKDDVPFTRESFARYLLDNNIEVRPIMAGNLLLQPPYQKIKSRIVGSLKNSNNVYHKGLFIPCCPMEKEQEENYLKVLKGFLSKYD